MKFSKWTQRTVIITLSLFLSHAPQVAFAETVQSLEMLPTSAVLAEVSREQTEKDVRDLLQSQEIRRAFEKQGLSADEASLRIAALSDQELRQLSSQLKEARAGGDILVTILVIVLIIFLIKRI